jgi:hypothetical protein
MSKLSKVFPDFNKKFTPGGVSDLTFRSFPMLSCPDCPDSGVMTTDDGNQNQTCVNCNKVLRKNGKDVSNSK